MKIRSEVYKQIRDKLKQGMPALQYVDLQKGQMSNKPQNYPVPLPACLVEFRQPNWSESTGGQLGDCYIRFYLYIDHVTDSFDGAELENETIELLDNLDELYELMQGFSGENFNPLNRTTDDIVEYKDRYVCYRTDFRTTLFHNDKIGKTAEKPEVNLNFKFKK